MYVVKHHTKNKGRIVEKFTEYVKINQQKKKENRTPATTHYP